jgi:XTP/dITP diphosphohydrolase
MRRLVLATGNPHKVEEMAAMLAAAGLPLTVHAARSLGPAPTIVEDQDSFLMHAALKARGIARWLAGQGEPGDTLVLADDSGVCVDALDGAPGVDSAVFAGPQADDAANNAHLLAQLAARGLETSPAHYVCLLALTRVDGAPLPRLPGAEPSEPDLGIFVGRWDGEIRRGRAGAGGFGYDPHFWVAGPDGERSAAQLAPDEKHARSHRGQAVRRLLAALPGLLG